MTANERAARAALLAPTQRARLDAREATACSRLRALLAARGTDRARVGAYAVTLGDGGAVSVARVAAVPVDQLPAFPELEA